ncbi:tudor domain-containing protein 15 [Stegastes partitus]|uniref:Tudor domain-containing protein 15 n=1 Tax=Stegastes partitus TaxID=144197 RepID=A0A9Y4JP07_9TELE|nr:PREDICTED: tudor domain-containing protein 15-like [Stegastes partitus]
MQPVLDSGHQKSQDSGPSVPCALWPVDLKLTHLDWNPEATLIHFQGQHLTICELDYNILQSEIQNAPKTEAAVDVGEFCLVEDLTSARWFRGRVENRKEDSFDVFLIDHGNVLSVDVAHISSCSGDFFILPPKIVCGFLANVLLLQSCPHSVVEVYLSSLIGRNVAGYIQALLCHEVLLLEVPDINSDLVRHGFGRHVDTDTFLFLVEMLTEVPLKQSIASVPDLLIQKPRGQEMYFKSSGLQGYEDILSFCGPKLSCGTQAKVRVTAAVNPGLFYCQVASMEADLWEMSKKLAAVCESRTKECNQKTPENLGLLCSIKGKDGKWYRGFVQFLSVNSQVRVLFIDYGFFESVKVENIHRLPPEFHSTPIMAFACSLSSLTDQDHVLKTQQLSFLKAGLLGGMLDVEISGFDEKQHLYSVTVIGLTDNNVKEPEPIQKLCTFKAETVLDTKPSRQAGCLHYETVVGEALVKTLKAEEVQVGLVFVGYVEHVGNPNHFWIRTQKRNDEFEEMTTKMMEHFSQTELDEDVLMNPEPGTLCCAVYEKDMHFYRGVVTDTLEHGAEVLFIDFGNIEKVPRMLIKNIPETFASKSPFAMCCSLVNVFPLEDVWTSSALNFFRQIVTNKALLVRVVQMRKNTLVVDLFEMGGDKSRSITELLISSKQAEYIPIEPVVQNNTRLPQCSATMDISGNTEQWSDCEEEEKSCRNEIEKDQAPASFKALNIEPGCEFAVRCPYISSPSDFWCQPLDKVPALEELMEKVQQYYSTHTAPLRSGDSCCVAQSPCDGRWYRAFIIEKQKGLAKIVLVDHGRTVEISENSLQAIMPEYFSLEGQAFRCRLDNLIKPADPKNCGDWSPEVCNLLKVFVLHSGSSLKCRVASHLNVKNTGLCNVVDLYNIQTQQSVTKKLLEQGLASRVTVSTKQPLTVFPDSFVYSSYGLRPGNEEHVYVTHVSSQWEVYCHLERNTEIIEELEKNISEESEKMMQASTRAVVRKLCLAKYLNGMWYRGLTHPVQLPLHLSVFFVDYGNTSIVEKSNVMFIPRDSGFLLYTPMQAMRCSLDSVSKVEPYADVKEWLTDTVLNKLVTVKIIEKSENGSFVVQLFDGKVNINEKVKELILDLSQKPKTVSLNISSTKTKHHRKNISVKRRSQPTGQSLGCATSNVKRGAEKNTKQLVHGRTQNKNTKAKQQNEDKSKSRATVQPLKNSPVQQPRGCQDAKSERSQQSRVTQVTRLSHLPDKNVSAGFLAECFASHIDSVNSFFLQLSEDEPAILKLGDDLNTSILRASLKTTTSLRINDVVLAEYEEDGAVYRSVVKSFEASSCVKVEFVDYGNSAVIGKEKIYSIPEEYLCQPRFSIPCSLLDKSMYGNDASFTDTVMEKRLMVDFVQQNGTQWEVKIEVQDAGDGLNMALEAAVESSPLTEREEESPMSSCETEQKVRSCEKRQEVFENERSKSEGTMPSVGGENLMAAPPPVTLIPRLKVKACRCHRGTPARKKRDSKAHRKTKTCSVKAVRNVADVFRPAPIQAKDTENGTILSVQSNGCFYVRLTRFTDQLAALESCITTNLNKCRTLAGEDIKQGLKCLVQTYKDKWQRGVVQQINEQTYKALLVDHGVTKEFPSGSIRQQCSDLAQIPNLAVLCKMNNLGFSAGEDTQKLWCQTLKTIISKEVQVVFTCYSEADNLWMVEITIDGLFLMTHVETLSQRNEEKIPSPAETQNESKAEGCTSDMSPPQQLAFVPVDLDKAYSGFAAAVITPFEFCIVLEDSLLVRNRLSIMLDELPTQMASLPEAHLLPGTCCLLKSDSRNEWCRGEIVHADTTVVLNLVDYGHYEYMPHDDCSKLKKLPVEITDLPKVTNPCSLRGVTPVAVDGQWTDEAVVFFQQCLYQKNLQIFFREFVSDTHWKVDIMADGVHVAKELVDAGHATYIDVMLGLRFQEQGPCKALPQGSDCEEEYEQEEEGSDEA